MVFDDNVKAFVCPECGSSLDYPDYVNDRCPNCGCKLVKNNFEYYCPNCNLTFDLYDYDFINESTQRPISSEDDVDYKWYSKYDHIIENLRDRIRDFDLIIDHVNSLDKVTMSMTNKIDNFVRLYKIVVDKGLYRGYDRLTIISAIYYISSHMVNNPVMTTELSAIHNIDKKLIIRFIRKLMKFKIISYSDVKYNKRKVFSVVSRICNRLKLSSSMVDKVVDEFFRIKRMSAPSRVATSIYIVYNRRAKAIYDNHGCCDEYFRYRVSSGELFLATGTYPRHYNLGFSVGRLPSRFVRIPSIITNPPLNEIVKSRGVVDKADS